jgi:hypothetical protein
LVVGNEAQPVGAPTPCFRGLPEQRKIVVEGIVTLVDSWEV